MKKLMFAVAAMAAGIAVADITSSNIVGYQQQNWMPADFVMMGAQFDAVKGGSIKLSEINFGKDFTGPEYGDGDAYVKTAPQVQLAQLNTEGTKAYYFLSDGKWVGPSDNDYAPGWVDAGGNEADPEVPVGLGFWYKDSFNKNREFTNAGEVLQDSPWSKAFNAEFRMLVCPFPKAVKLSEINFVDIEKNAPEYGDGDSYAKTATQIQIPNATSEGFKTYYFLSDGKWVGPGDNDYAPGWVDAGGNEADEKALTIPAGRGCWFRPVPGSAGMTVEFSL